MFKCFKEYGTKWHYICENGHKWISSESPRGTYLYGIAGQTRCSVCKSKICNGSVYIDGKYAGMGAVHVDFKNKKKRDKK